MMMTEEPTMKKLRLELEESIHSRKSYNFVFPFVPFDWVYWTAHSPARRAEQQHRHAHSTQQLSRHPVRHPDRRCAEDSRLSGSFFPPICSEDQEEDDAPAERELSYSAAHSHNHQGEEWRRPNGE